MYCMDCHRTGVQLRTIRLGTRETAEVCVEADEAACRKATAARKAARK